jgi:hypothetical protein
MTDEELGRDDPEPASKLGERRFNEPEARVEARILVLAGGGRVVESAVFPGRWMIAVPGDPGDS